MKTFEDNNVKFIFVFSRLFFLSTPAKRIKFSDINKLFGFGDEKSPNKFVSFIYDLDFAWKFDGDRTFKKSFEFSVKETN